MMNDMATGNERKTLLVLTSKLGYQARGFAEAAEKLGVAVRFGTDRCHRLDDPWGDAALPLQFERAREAAEVIVREFAGNPPAAVLALGDRATPAAAYAAEAFGLPGNPPAAVETCRNKLRQREALSAEGMPVPDFFFFSLAHHV